MSENVTAIEPIRASLARIVYQFDLDRGLSRRIPLGVIAEATTASVRALGLIARTSLFDEEKSQIAWRMKEQLDSPFRFLKEEFEWAFRNTEPGEALVILASKFSESLLIEPPRLDTWRKAIPHGVLAPQPVLDELRRRRDDDFFLLLTESFPEPTSTDIDLEAGEEISRVAA